MQLSFMGTALAPSRVKARSGALPDDGMIDLVAVSRRLQGDQKVRLTGRERLAAVVLGASQGMTDGEIGTSLGLTAGYALKVRQRLGIPAGVAYRAYTPEGRVRPAGLRTVDHRGHRTLAGWRRNPVNQPLPLIYGLNNSHIGRYSDFYH